MDEKTTLNEFLDELKRVVRGTNGVTNAVLMIRE
jgi:hypothetical protein